MIREIRLMNLVVLGALVLGLFFAAIGSTAAATSQDVEDGGDVAIEAEMTIAQEDTLDKQLLLSKPRAVYCEWLSGRIMYHAQKGNYTRVDTLQNRYIRLCT